MSAVALLLLLSSFGMGESLAQRLLLRDGYDVNEWPNAESGIPTNVSVQLFINSFGSLNAANMDFTVDVFLRQRWRDPRLANITEKRERITVTSKELQNQIWKPDTFFNNVKDAELHKVTMPNVLLRIEQTGDVLYSIRNTTFPHITPYNKQT